MLVSGVSVLTILFSEEDLDLRELEGGRELLRIGPLFAVGPIIDQLQALVGREVQVAVSWSIREGRTRSFLSGRIVQIVSPLVLEPAAVEEPSPLEDQEPKAAKPKKTAKKEPKKRKALAQLLGE